MANFTESLIRGVKQGEDISMSPLRRRGQELSLKSQELGIDRQELENQRFTEKSNLASMVQGALEFTKINPQDNQAQIQFLQNRAEQINDRGGDPRDTLELIKLTPSQRVEAVQNVLMIGERAGLINPQKTPNQKMSKVQQFKQSLFESGIDPNSERGIKLTQDFASGKKSPLVNIEGDKQVQTEDVEFKKALGKEQAKRFSSIIKEGEDARNTIAALDQLDNIDVAKGIFEPAKVEFARVLQGFVAFLWICGAPVHLSLTRFEAASVLDSADGL